MGKNEGERGVVQLISFIYTLTIQFWANGETYSYSLTAEGIGES
jgi:hypothetical protein